MSKYNISAWEFHLQVLFLWYVCKYELLVVQSHHLGVNGVIYVYVCKPSSGDILL